MSMTKRHIDSLPAKEQDDILGKHNPEEEAECEDATWMTDNKKSNQFMHAMGLWLELRDSRAAAEAEGQLNPPQEGDKFAERNGARLEKKRGACVVETTPDGDEWRV
jgi:hypothetical protein